MGLDVVVNVGYIPPVGVEKPVAENTGPRTTVTGSTLSNIGSVMAVADANGGRVDGRFVVNPVSTQPSHVYELHDCDVTGLRGIEAWFGEPGVDVFPPVDGTRIKLYNCRIHDCPADGIAGRNIETFNCDFVRNGDHFKPLSNTWIRQCYMHDFWSEGEDPHGDVIQFFGGNDVLIEWNNMIAKNSLDSPTFPGFNGNAVLQPSWGEPISNFRFNDNWVDGGTITLRGAGTWGGMPAHLEFRRNKHGRGYGSFPVDDGMGSFNGGLAVSDYDSSNVWEDDGTPVLGG